MFKSYLKQLVVVVLWQLTRLIIKKYQPRLVGITGSVGKTSTKEAAAAVMQMAHHVRASRKSYNSELGIPLSVIGVESPWSSVFGWLRVVVAALRLLVLKADYPDWLILEVGADRPGDIKKVVRQLKFDVAIITQLPAVPVHVEFFPTPEAVAAEKMLLAKAVGERGLVILNYDDPRQMERRGEVRAHVLTYGLTGGDVRALNPTIAYTESEAGESSMPVGLTFKLEYEGSSVPVRLPGIVGEHQLSAVLPAAALGLQFGVNLVQVAEALGRLTTPPGRLRLLPGIKQTLILDDTYNASPAALAAGLATVAALKVSGRKIVVLGDMLELGHHTIEAHKAAGRQAATVADLILTVGVRTRFLIEGAKEAKFSAKKIHPCRDAEAAGLYLQKNIKAGDLIYLKGSQRMRLEKAVEEIMAEPENKGLLLCRQEPEWRLK